ncbi:MAG: CD1247 N-terminal domain-containing protein [Ruminococcus sp.]
MRMTEKIAYIKGLAEGLELDSSKNEVKVINQILELLDQMAAEVEELQDCYDDAVDVVDAINDDLSEVEDYVYDIDDDEDDDYCGDCCSCGDCDDEEENPLYEITCPQCEEKFTSDEDTILTGEVECPKCGAVLEFDFSDLEEGHEHGDGCCCGCGVDEHYGEDDLMS